MRQLSEWTVTILLTVVAAACGQDNGSRFTSAAAGGDDPFTALKARALGSAIPGAPVLLTGATTQNVKVPFRWMRSGVNAFGSGNFRYKLGAADWVETRDTFATAVTPVTAATVSIEVQESNLRGEWSPSASLTANVLTKSVVDPNAFYPTHVTTATPVDFKVIEVLPPPVVPLVGSSTLTFTTDDIIDVASIDDTSVVVSVGDERYFGTFSGELTHLTPVGTALSFTPLIPFPAGAEVKVHIVGGGLKDDDGGKIADAVYTYHVSGKTPRLIEGGFVDLNPANSPTGQPWILIGNAAVAGPIGEIKPVKGDWMAVMTTGVGKDLSPYPAVVGSQNAPQISMMIIRLKIPPGSTNLVFNYDFISAEFDEFVDSAFDDIFTISITGKNGRTLTKTMASVKIVGKDDSTKTVFPIIEDPSPQTPVEHSGAVGPDAKTTCKLCATPSFDITGLGGEELTVSFLVSDIADGIYDTAVAIDNIRFETVVRR